MADIFLSYSSADRVKAKAIANLFEAAGWSVWIDRFIGGGMEWNPRLHEELQLARCVVVLWTRNSVASEWVQKEAQVARERKVLLPVLLHPVTPPGSLAEVQATTATAWIDDTNSYELQPLLDRTAALLGCEAPRIPGGPEQVTSSQISRIDAVEAAFEFCSARLEFFHQRKSDQGASEEAVDRMQATYKQLVEVLSPVSSDDIHALIAKHEGAFTPRDDVDVEG